MTQCDFVQRVNLPEIGVVVGGPTVGQCKKETLPNLTRCGEHIDKDALILAYRWALAGKLKEDGSHSPDFQDILFQQQVMLCALKDLSKAGDHEGACEKDPITQSCSKHVKVYKDRLWAAKEVISRIRS